MNRIQRQRWATDVTDGVVSRIIVTSDTHAPAGVAGEHGASSHGRRDHFDACPEILFQLVRIALIVYAAVTILDVRLTTAGFGLPVGADIQVGVAAAWVVLPPTT